MEGSTYYTDKYIRHYSAATSLTENQHQVKLKTEFSDGVGRLSSKNATYKSKVFVLEQFLVCMTCSN